MKKSSFLNDIIKNMGKDKLILLLIAGVVLVICSVWEEDKEAEDVGVYETDENGMSGIEEEYIEMQEKRLKAILECVEGVGEVNVMITIKESSEKNILNEQDYEKESVGEVNGAGDSYVYKEDNQTIYRIGEDGSEEPYVVSERLPRIEGVAVVAEGAKDIIVKEKIIDIIKALFDIEINKISVTK